MARYSMILYLHNIIMGDDNSLLLLVLIILACYIEVVQLNYSEKFSLL
jgi:hypothetical protein